MKRLLYSIYASSILCIALIHPAFAEERKSEPIELTIRQYKEKLVPKVFFGKPAAQGDYPWQVGLLVSSIADPYMAQFCGGSIIGDKWVITAGHCVDGATKEEDVHVFSGDVELGAGPAGSRVTVEKIWRYKKYQGGNPPNYDLALIKTSTSMKGAAIDLPKANRLSEIKAGIAATISGWGRTEAGSRANVLQFGQMKVISNRHCNGVNIWNGKVTDVMLCAGDPLDVKGSVAGCNGDSGGPLTFNEQLIGIVSWGPTQCGKTSTVFTRVSKFADHVRECVLQGKCDSAWK